MNDAIQTTATGIGERFLTLLTDNTVNIIAAIVVGSILAILVTEFVKRYKVLFHGHMSAREWTMRARLTSSVIGAVTSGLMALVMTKANYDVKTLFVLMAMIFSITISGMLYDCLRWLMPKLMESMLKRVRGE